MPGVLQGVRLGGLGDAPTVERASYKGPKARGNTNLLTTVITGAITADEVLAPHNACWHHAGYEPCLRCHARYLPARAACRCASVRAMKSAKGPAKRGRSSRAGVASGTLPLLISIHSS